MLKRAQIEVVYTELHIITRTEHRYIHTDHSNSLVRNSVRNLSVVLISGRSPQPVGQIKENVNPFAFGYWTSRRL